MRAILAFIRAYPGQTAVVLASLFLAGMVEGMSLTALLPAISVAFDRDQGRSAGGASGVAVEALRHLGIEPSITSLLVVLVVGSVATSAIGLLARRQVGYTVAQVATDLRLALLRALVSARWEYYLRQPVGRLTNAISTEASGAAQAYLFAATMTASAIQAIAYTTVALAVSWKATLAYVAAATVTAAILHRLVIVARKAGRRQNKVLARMIAGLADTLQSVKPLKAMAREDLADGVLAAQTLDVDRAMRRQVISKEGRRAAQQPIFTGMIALGTWAGLELWHLPMAKVLVLMLLLAKVLGNFGKVQGDYQDLASSETFYWSLRATLDDAEQHLEALTGTAAPRLDRGIAFEAVDFGYGATRVLSGCSLEIPAGSCTTLIGESGAGKTTVVDLIVGLVRPQAGRVRIDGVDLGDLDLRAWRRMIGYVPQENLLLHDTVLRNVTLGDPALGPRDAEEALRAAGVWEFIARLPDGLGTLVGERGARFSGGQRQRIMIARALVHRPRLLILDEATAALDPATEAEVRETLAALRGRVTVLAISHQRALVDVADRVYRIGKGGADLEIDRPELRRS